MFFKKNTMKINFNSFNTRPINLLSNQAKNINFKSAWDFDKFQKQEPKHIKNLSDDFQNPIKIVFSDIDGTMIANSIPYLHKNVYKSMIDLKEKNIPLILTTGRSINEVFSFTNRMPYHPDFLILEQGAYITDNLCRPIYKNPITEEDANKVFDFYKEYSKEDRCSQLVTYINGREYLLNSYEVAENYLFPENLNYLQNKFAKGDLPTKFLLFLPRYLGEDGRKKVLNTAKLFLDSDKFSMMFTDPHYFEISKKSASKGNAAKFIAEKYGIELQNALGIGDGENDISLISTIQNEKGLGIAMGNAQKCLKERANFVTDNVSDYGFATAIDSVLKHNKQFKKL